MLSERLTYQPVTLESVDDFHELVEDAHVRRFLMDGQLFPREWSEQRVQDSINLFERRGVGLWLARQRESDALVGFCGFLEIPSVHADPQLVYAMFERFTGMGYATEMTRTAIAEARRQRGFETIVAAVDEENVASVRVLRKIGFRQVSTQAGSVGKVLVMLLEPSDTIGR
jgi:RimJ/RimL family protein N-acetyltransferase